MMQSEFIVEITSLPTVIFTGAVILMSLYWIMVIIGAVDLDVLGGADGAIEGAVEAAVEGGAEGMIEGATEALESAGEIFSLLSFVGFGKVPATIVLSFLAIWSWMACGMSIHLLGGVEASTLIRLLIGAGVFLGAIFVSMPLTSLSVRPLVGVFSTKNIPSRQSLVGESCVVEVWSKDQKWGQAEAKKNGLPYVVRIHAVDQNESGFERGDQALLLTWDQEKESYLAERIAPASTQNHDLSTRTPSPMAQGSSQTKKEL